MTPLRGAPLALVKALVGIQHLPVPELMKQSGLDYSTFRGALDLAVDLKLVEVNASEVVLTDAGEKLASAL